MKGLDPGSFRGSFQGHFSGSGSVSGSVFRVRAQGFLRRVWVGGSARRVWVEGTNSWFLCGSRGSVRFGVVRHSGALDFFWRMELFFKLFRKKSKPPEWLRRRNRTLPRDLRKNGEIIPPTSRHPGRRYPCGLAAFGLGFALDCPAPQLESAEQRARSPLWQRFKQGRGDRLAAWGLGAS